MIFNLHISLFVFLIRSSPRQNPGYATASYSFSMVCPTVVWCSNVHSAYKAPNQT